MRLYGRSSGRSAFDRRVRVVPRLHAFERRARSEHVVVRVAGSDDLHSDRETVIGQARRNRCRGMTGEIERLCKQPATQLFDLRPVDRRRVVPLFSVRIP